MGGPKYTKKQKEQFSELIDKGGTVRAAARKVGVQRGAVYRWLRKAGLSMFRGTPRVYTDAEKAEFFRRLEARRTSRWWLEAGVHPGDPLCLGTQGGIFTSEARKVNPRSEEFFRLRGPGLSRAEARSGEGGRSLRDRLGQRHHDGPPWSDLSRWPHRALSRADINGMTPHGTARAIGGRVDLDRVERVIHPRYLSLVEREQLQDLRRAGRSIRQIAADLGRSPSTISRELRRNTASKRGYLPHTAHRLSVDGADGPGYAEVLVKAELLAYVEARLKKRSSLRRSAAG